MERSGLILLLALALLPSMGRAAAADVLEARIRDASRQVAAAERPVARASRDRDDLADVLEEARARLVRADRARRHAGERVGTHQAAVETLRAQEAELTRKLGVELDARRIGPYLDTLERKILSVGEALKRITTDTGYRNRLDQLRSEWAAADDDYWEARRLYEHALSDCRVAEGRLAVFQAELAERRETLADLRIEALQAPADTLPAYLEQVIATQDGSTVYDARWIRRRVELDREIRLVRRAIDDQRLQVRARRAGFDEAYRELEAAGGRMDRLSAEYEQAIWTQAYQTILTQLGGATVNIVLGLERGGAASTLIEAVSRIADVATTDYGARYDLPVLAQGTTEGASSVAQVVGKPFGEAAVNRYKNAILSTVEAFAGGRLSLEGTEGFLAEVWVTPKLATQEPFPVRVVDVRAQLLSIRGGTEAATRIRDSMLGTLKRFDFRGFLKEAGTGLLVDAAENLKLEALKDERIEAFRRWVAFDAEIAVHRQALTTQRLLWQQERAQLTALHLALDELLDQRRDATLERILHVEVDEPVDRDRPLTVELTFSRDVEHVRAGLESEVLELSGRDRSYAATLPPPRLGGLPSISYLTVRARDVLKQRRIDQHPETTPYLNGRGALMNYETVVYGQHFLRFDEMPGERSVALVLDLSGSMEERLAGDLAALRRVLHQDRWGPADEFSLWVFQGSEIKLLQPFTVRRTLIEQALDRLHADGGTPLARAITRSGMHLLAAGRHDDKVLLIFSDGQDTEGRKPELAMRTLRARAVEIEGGLAR